MKETIDIHYLRPITPLAQSNQGDWIDLRAGKSIDLKKGETAIIPLGFSAKLPKGYEALVAPRSSSMKKFGFIQTNSIGVIDETYAGDNDEWGLPVYALRDSHIEFNDRICQFRIIKHQPEIMFNTVEKLENKDRGGFGSTGHK